jgi:hypothetical protein
MKFVYLIMIDSSGSMRSTEDEPVMAFGSREEAERYLNDNTIKSDPTSHNYINGRCYTSYCGGFSAKIIGVQFMNYLDNSKYLTHGNGD